MSAPGEISLERSSQMHINSHKKLGSWSYEHITKRLCGRLGAAGAVAAVAALLVSLHIAAHTEVLAATLMLTLVRLLAGMRIGVDLQRAGSGEGLAACGADIAFLCLRI